MGNISNSKKTWVGLFIFASLIILIAGILSIGNLHSTFVKKMHLVTFFKDVNGLQTGNNIWFSGVKIGTVNKLQFQPDNSVKIIMNIDEMARQYIRKDAHVKIGTDGLIGNKILILYGGSAIAGEAEAGDTLWREAGSMADDMMAMLAENNKNLLAITNNLKTVTVKLANGTGTVGKLIHDETLFNDLQTTAQSLVTASTQAKLLLINLNNFTQNLNAPQGSLHKLTTDTTLFNSLQKSIQSLEYTLADAKQTMAGLKTALANPNSPLGVLTTDEKSGTEIKSILQNLEKSTITLETDLKALQSNFLLRRYFRKNKK